MLTNRATFSIAGKKFVRVAALRHIYQDSTSTLGLFAGRRQLDDGTEAIDFG